MKTLIAVCTLCAALTISSAAQVPDQSARSQIVVSAAWLKQHATDPNLVLLHVGTKTTYDAGHIAGARFVDYSTTLAASNPGGGLTLEMLPADLLRERLVALGISNDSRVVVYQSDDYWTPSTRVMLTLDYAGLNNVAWLDGGQKAWTAAGGTLTTDVPAVKNGTLAPLKTRAVVVDADFVKAHLHTPAFAIVDSRAPAFYDGTRTGGRPPSEHKTGHIAGAVNVPFDSFTTADVQLKPAEEVAAGKPAQPGLPKRA